MKIKLIKYIGNEKTEKHQHDYRWILDKKERLKWIKKHWIYKMEKNEKKE